MTAFSGISEMVGNTPLLELARFDAEHNLAGKIFAKLEKNNPAGSSKDRVAKYMIAAAERDGRLRAGGTIIEPTSGNTGIGLAALARGKGYRVILTMPSTMSPERVKLLRAYGAEVVLTDGTKGMAGAIAEADRLAAAIPGAFVPGRVGRNGRNADGNGSFFARKNSRHLPCGRRAGRLARPVGRQTRPPCHSGHRRRLCPRNPRYVAL